MPIFIERWPTGNPYAPPLRSFDPAAPPEVGADDPSRALLDESQLSTSNDDPGDMLPNFVAKFLFYDI